METILHVEDGKYLGQTKFAPNLLLESLALCIKEVRGVAALGKKLIGNKFSSGIQIKRCKDSSNLIIDVDIWVLHGNSVPDVAYHVQEAVINTAAQLTSDKIDQVNVYVRGTKYGSSAKQK